jgi:MinD-like ATPase involved in chromosome partitioning or flagellar assembly
MAIALADRSSRCRSCVLVDADTSAPAIAPRLALPLEPSIRGALERLEQGASLANQLHRVDRLDIVGGLADPRDWAEIRPAQVQDLVRELRTTHDIVVVDVGRSLEAASRGLLAGSGRNGVSRQLVGEATAVVAVGAPTPVGVARLLDWFADVRSLTSAPVHVVVNRVARRGFELREVEREVLRAFPAAAVWPVRANADVPAAAWQGAVVASDAR